MLSQKCKYAIRAVIFLASRCNQKQLTGGTEIAEKLNMPTAFTIKILQELAKKNIIYSSKGPKGGFYITEELKSTPILKIVEAIDDLSIFHKCGIGLHECSDDRPCPFHETFKEIRQKLFTSFNTKTIGDFSVDYLNDYFYLADEN